MKEIIILDENYNRILQNIIIIGEPTNAPTKQFFVHPLDDGSEVVDHTILKQNKFDLPCTLNNKKKDIEEIYSNLENYFLTDTPLILQTKVKIYENLYIESLPQKHRFNNLDFTLKLVERQKANTSVTFAPKQPKQSNTVDRGKIKSTTTPPAKKQSVLSRLIG